MALISGPGSDDGGARLGDLHPALYALAQGDKHNGIVPISRQWPASRITSNPPVG